MDPECKTQILNNPKNKQNFRDAHSTKRTATNQNVLFKFITSYANGL